MSERPTVTVRNSGQIRYDPDDVYAAVLTGSLTPGTYELVPVGWRERIDQRIRQTIDSHLSVVDIPLRNLIHKADRELLAAALSAAVRAILEERDE